MLVVLTFEVSAIHKQLLDNDPMPAEPDKSLDILGIKPIAHAVEKVTDGVVDGAKAFLGRICLPAAEEMGLLLQDHVKSWRSRNMVSLAQKAEKMVQQHHGDAKVRVHPRIAHAVFEEASWIDDEVTHRMWAGLLASGCESTGNDDSNVVFIGILRQLTAPQVRILRHTIENVGKYVSSGGWPYAGTLEFSAETLKNVSLVEDEMRLDRELDHLRSLELIGSMHLGGGGGGFSSESGDAQICPSPLALHLYVRGEGFPGSPIEFWNLEKKPRK